MARCFPHQGQSPEQVLTQLKALKAQDTDPEKGRLNIYTHYGQPALDDLRWQAQRIFSHTNAFLAGYLPGTGALEREVLDMARDIVRAHAKAPAFITAGGTESIFCAIHSCREWARYERGINESGEVIVPYSAHAAFDKACHYLGLKIVRVPIGEDLRADPEAMAQAINDKTIGMVGSAPSWPFGLIDDIEALARICQQKGLWLHVDACVGGFINPWLEALGEKLPKADFRVPGVCSLSADLHKHGYAAKPCSVVFYRDESAAAHHHVSVDHWPVGEYKTSGFLGSRPAAPVASAWAVMKHLGKEGYMALAKQSLEVKRTLEHRIESIPEASFRCLKNHSTMIYFRSEVIDMLTVLGGMVERGYFPFGIFNPIMIQLIAEPIESKVVDRYMTDLTEVVMGVRDGSITSTAISRYG